MNHPLTEGYFKLRLQSEGLKSLSHHFEGLDWKKVGKSMTRTATDGWKLVVYRIENDIEACVISPTGESQTFA